MFKFFQEHRYLVYLSLVVYWIILLIATSLPAPDLPDVWGSDKIKHFLAYMVLSFLLNLAYLIHHRQAVNPKRAAIVTLAICFFYGLFDEIHQIFIPGRSAEVLDLAADTLGAVMGVLLVLYLVRKNNYYHA